MSNENPYNIVDLSKPTEEIILNLVNKHNPNLWNEDGGIGIALTADNAEVLEVQTYGVEESQYYGDTRARVHGTSSEGYRGWIWVYYYRVDLQEFVTKVFDGREPKYRAVEGQTVGEFVEESLSHSSVLALDPEGIKNKDDLISVKNEDGSLKDSGIITLQMFDDDPVFRGSADIYYYPSPGLDDPMIARIYPHNGVTINLYFTSEDVQALNIDWGDGEIYENLNGGLTGRHRHTYSTEKLPEDQKYFQLKINRVDAEDLCALRIAGAGFCELESFGNLRDINEVSFENCTNLMNVPSYIPPTITSYRNMFKDCNKFNGSGVIDWNTSTCTDISGIFQNVPYFNQPIKNWDVSNVTDMSYTFRNADAFDQPLNDWNVSNVNIFTGMFSYNEVFNQPLDNWDVSNAVNMAYMFQNASLFNQDLSTWDVSKVTTFGGFNSGGIIPEEFMPALGEDDE